MVEAALPVIGASIVLAYFAGLRQSEISALTRETLVVGGKEPRVSVDQATKHTEDGGTVIGRPKSLASRRVVPLPDVAAKWLQSYEKEHVGPALSDLVVYRPHARTLLTSDCLHKGKGRWRDVREQAGLPDTFRFHDLRRACLTRAGQAGTTLAELKTIAGHEDAETVIIYQVVEKERLWGLMNRIGDPELGNGHQKLV